MEASHPARCRVCRTSTFTWAVHPAACALALLDWIAARGTQAIGVCDAARCDDVFADAAGAGHWRFCSATSSNRQGSRSTDSGDENKREDRNDAPADCRHRRPHQRGERLHLGQGSAGGAARRLRYRQAPPSRSRHRGLWGCSGLSLVWTGINLGRCTREPSPGWRLMWLSEWPQPTPTAACPGTRRRLRRRHRHPPSGSAEDVTSQLAAQPLISHPDLNTGQDNDLGCSGQDGQTAAELLGRPGAVFAAS